MRYEKYITGKYALPPLSEVLDDLFLFQGDIQRFLQERCAEIEPQEDDEAGMEAERKALKEQEQLLFEIMFELKEKGNEEHDKKFQLLQQLHAKQQQVIIESNLMKCLTELDTARSKPEKLLSILERLDPVKWGKASVNAKNKKANAFEDILNE